MHIIPEFLLIFQRYRRIADDSIYVLSLVCATGRDITESLVTHPLTADWLAIIQSFVYPGQYEALCC